MRIFHSSVGHCSSGSTEIHPSSGGWQRPSVESWFAHIHFCQCLCGPVIGHEFGSETGLLRALRVFVRRSAIVFIAGACCAQTFTVHDDICAIFFLDRTCDLLAFGVARGLKRGSIPSPAVSCLPWILSRIIIIVVNALRWFSW